MSGKSKKPGDTLSRLRDELAADVLSATDDEIFAETRELEIDPEAAANRVASLLQRAIFDAGRQKLAAARAELDSQQAKSGRIRIIDISRARNILDDAAQRNPEIRQRLTLAARNGEALSDGDIQSLVEDLLDLGIVDDMDL